MACVSPLYIPASSNVSRLGLYDSYKRFHRAIGDIYVNAKGDMFYRVPCGWCLNCRVDRRNWLEDSVNYDLNHLYNGIGSFVTLTYDNFHILDNVVIKKNIFGIPETRFDSNNRPLLTCKMSDGVKFIKKLRSYIKYHNLDCPAIRKDFKYVICTEYGEEKNRCHIHLLLLGIHPKIAYKLLVKCWSKGIVDAGEIKKGGVRYIVDYMDKLPKGKQLDEQFNAIGIEPPKMKHSLGLGRKLIFDNLDFILKNDLCYPAGPFGKTRPIPSYWKKVLLKRNENYNKYIKNVSDKMYSYKIEKKSKAYSFSEMNKFVAGEAIKQHKKREIQIRNKGNVPPFVYYQSYMNSEKQLAINRLVNKALIASVPF